MAKKKKEVQDLSQAELSLRLEELQKEIYNLRSEKLDSKTQKTHLIRAARKEVARIKTKIRQGELA